MKKRIAALLVALSLCLSLWPLPALADTTDVTKIDPTPEKDDFPDDATDVSVFIRHTMDAKLSKPYDGTSVPEPTLDNDIYLQVGRTNDPNTKYYKPPAGTILDCTFYTGNILSNPTDPGRDPISAPKDAGGYTLRVTATVPASTADPDAAATPRNFVGAINFTISQRTLNPTLRTDITKPYDGRADYPDSLESPIDYAASDVVPNDDVTFEGVFGYDNSNVGKDKTFTAHITAVTGDDAGNYAALTDAQTIITTNTASITQATPSPKNVSYSLIVRNRRAQEYTLDLSTTLPTLSSSLSYGTLTFSEPPVTSLNQPGYFNDPDKDIKLDADGKTLRVTTKAASHDGTVDVGSITYTVHSTNFTDITLTIRLIGADKTQLDITGLEPMNQPYTGSGLLGYGGLAQFTNHETKEPVSDITLVASYEGYRQTNYGPTATMPVEPGDYIVTLSVPDENADYTGQWQQHFTITRATLTITATDKAVKVDEFIPSLKNPELDKDYTVRGMAPGHELRTPPTMEYKPFAETIAVEPGEFDIVIRDAQVPDDVHYEPTIKYVNGKLRVTSLTPDEELPFSDVTDYAWYGAAVKYAYSYGLMLGMTDTLFGPENNISRAMVVTLLYRMENKPYVWSENPFSDVPSTEYYHDPIRWASYNRLVGGYGDGRFGPDDPLSREQLALILYNYTRYYKGLSVNRAAALDQYEDNWLIDNAAYYRAIQWACAEGLMSGRSDTRLAPQGTTTRAELASLLMRYCLNICPPLSAETAEEE